MFINVEFIVGISFGFEWLEEEHSNYFIIDLGIARVLVEKFKEMR